MQVGGGFGRRGQNRHFATWAAKLLCSLLATFSLGYSQVYTSGINGTVHDSSGSVVPDTTITLANVDTGIQRQTVTTSSGTYVLLEIAPGSYTLEASKAGFGATKLSQFQLAVSQTTTLDFTLQVGTVQQSVTVQAVGELLESSSAGLGSVISEHQVKDLPLNGRNFTQLLTLTPGASPVNVAQSGQSYGVFSPVTKQSQVVFPSMNGQANRSNFFYMDGINDEGAFASTYAVPPIIDAIEEFKVQSHVDTVDFGGNIGGTINVITKSGTNTYHGSLWEFLRNDALDARNTFQKSVTPLRYNMYGATLGGPVLLPKLYNGRNKTFFFVGWQGFRFNQPANSYYRVPTAANIQGDLSDWPEQIYNPATTRANPGVPGTFLRDPFPGNRIPANLLVPGMVYYLQNTLPAPIQTGLPNLNAQDTTPTVQNEEEYTARLDQTFGPKDSFWFRYSGLIQDTTSSGGRQQFATNTNTGATNIGVNWVHTFNPTTVLQVQFGYSQGYQNAITSFRSLPANFGKTVGWNSTVLTQLDGSDLIPSVSATGYFGGGESKTLNPNLTNITQYRSHASKIIGNHTLDFGGDLSSNNFENLSEVPLIQYDAEQTSDPANPGATGSPLASLLLALPNNVWKRDVHETERWGGVMGLFLGDRWKVTPKLTINIGLRYDRKWQPPYGKWDTVGKPGGIEAGLLDLTRGLYILQVVPPTCAARGYAPCLPDPTGALPAHVIVDPRQKIYHDSNLDFSPRLGLAYRLGEKTTLRTGFGILNEEWADDTQQSQNQEGNWPDTANIELFNLNTPTTQAVSGLDPWPNLLPAPTPFTGGASGGADPYLKTEYSMQWNFGVQRQLTSATLVSLNYVGSGNRNGRLGGFYNTALTPGPGNPQARALYPYITSTYYQRSWARSDYQAFQFRLEQRFHDGLTYAVNYTYSKSIDNGCSGYENPEGCAIQDPYHFNNDRSVSAFDLPHIFTANWVYQLPLGKGKLLDTGNRVANYVIGNWQLNGILSLHSGVAYNLTLSGDTANIGSGAPNNRPNVVGDWRLPNSTPAEWFNTKAFAITAPFTFGNLGRNVLRNDWTRNLDISLFREFPISETKKFQFRFEAFNVFNQVVYGTPGTTPGFPNFGVVTSTQNLPRIGQASLKFLF
jgi:hypothetical protein